MQYVSFSGFTMSDDYRKRKFFAAVLNGRHGEVARYISRGRANPAWKHGEVGSGMSALDHAAYLGHVRIAELLLDNGWDWEARNYLGGRPLHCCAAAGNGHVEMIQLLVNRGAMLDSQDNLKNTPLHYAAGEGHAAAVRLLLSLGADRTIKNGDGKTAEDLAKDENTRAAFKDQDTQQAAADNGAKKKKRTASGKLVKACPLKKKGSGSKILTGGQIIQGGEFDAK